MADVQQPDMDKLHAALTSAGLGQGGPNISKLSAELSKQGINPQAQGIIVFCHSSHFCVIIRDESGSGGKNK